MDCKLTYFTPTYNRATMLHKLYESLCRQNDKNFIWQIVDDGSKDNTKQVVDEWIKENKINIEYIYKDNGGKNSAMEVSFQKCSTEYVCIVDSDDYLSYNSTEVIYKYIPLCGDGVVGLVTRRAHYDGSPFNNAWCSGVEELYFKELSTKYGYTEDTCLIFKTNIIKNYHFPRIENEKFITESVFYNQFMYDYKLIAIPECIYLAEYQDDGYTSQGLDLFFKNPKGFLYALKQNAYYAKKYKNGLKHVIYNSAYYYAWKNILKIKDDFRDVYKIKFPFNVLGWAFQMMLISEIKKKYKLYLSKQKGGI